MEITAKSKVQDVLTAFPALEEKIIQLAPPFKNLTNPVLRRAVGRLATLEKVAQIGNMDVLELVNQLRREVGQPELKSGKEAVLFTQFAPDAGDPDWIMGEPQYIVNGTEMLARGEVPLNRVNELLVQLAPGGYILLLTNFKPAPMIEAIAKQNRRVYHKVDPRDSQLHLTFFQ
ncbi:MAG: DUF1858 domain-containing protein [Anaerolineales bacterium]